MAGGGICDYKHNLCLSCVLCCTVSLNHTKTRTESPSVCLNLTTFLLLVFDFKFFLAGCPEARAVPWAVP